MKKQLAYEEKSTRGQQQQVKFDQKNLTKLINDLMDTEPMLSLRITRSINQRPTKEQMKASMMLYAGNERIP